MRQIVLLALLALAACDDDKPRKPREPKPAGVETLKDECAPVKNDSFAGAFAIRDCIMIPACGTKVERDDGIHYVTKEASKPTGGTMTLEWEIEASADAVFVPTEGDSSPRVTLYFQRNGDDNSARGKYGAYRWYSRTRQVTKPGSYTLTAPLAFAQWRAVETTAGNEGNFNASVQDMARLGFVFGGGNVGHGVCMKTGTAKFRVKYFGSK